MIHPDVAALIEDCEASRFYGNIVLDFQCGKVVLIRKTETLKPSDERTNRSEKVASEMIASHHP